MRPSHCDGLYASACWARPLDFAVVGGQGGAIGLCRVIQLRRARYALRKQTVEPVFGIIKSVMGFRQFSLRGLQNVTGEWTLVCLAWNLKRMAVLRLP